MIHCDHFIYGYFKNMGYRLLKSRGVDTLITSSQLNYLSHLGDKAEELTYSQTYYPDNDVLAISKITPARDQYYRRAIWNHTLIFTLSDCLTIARRILEPYFIAQHGDLSNPLPPIEVM